MGHAGTLDPAATGLLVVGLGWATRLLQFIKDREKEYLGEVAFGVATDTLDGEGRVVAEADASCLTREALVRAAGSFVGTYLQRPPAFSSLKVGGRRAYELARAGREVELEGRPVTIYRLDILSFEPGERARARLLVRCSGGTYLRSLARDLGDALGLPAHLASLRRTEVSPFRVERAVSLDTLRREGIDRHLIPPEGSLPFLPRREVREEEARAALSGRPIPRAGLSSPYALYGPGGLLLGVFRDADGAALPLVVRPREEAGWLAG